MDATQVKGELRSASTIPTEQCVVISGMNVMLVLSVGSLDIQQKARFVLILVCFF